MVVAVQGVPRIGLIRLGWGGGGGGVYFVGCAVVLLLRSWRWGEVRRGG
jgi:hypothetical protein